MLTISCSQLIIANQGIEMLIVDWTEAGDAIIFEALSDYMCEIAIISGRSGGTSQNSVTPKSSVDRN
ncbi:hypothetical protein [Ectobacillus panaciterrae]|uniref:hypothetical protein n=1 Tax=Ectobacillus panaciterrae TaxID=363872 RepID=UPI00048A9E7C|nr:hypothetical protein [Ectobacillus panaciterrae]